MSRILAGFLILAAWLGAAATAPAQDWPARPVKIIIPLGPGGGGDVFTRLIAEELQKRLGQPFVVENRPGGGLNIGTRACAEAAPDGYTFCVLSGEPVVYNQFTFKNLPFNPEKDFEPVVEPVHQRQRAGGQFPAQRQDDPGTGGAGQGQARHAELRHLLVHAGLFHGPVEQEERHRHRAGAVSQRQRDGQRGHGQHDADRISRPRQHDRPGQERTVHRARAQFHRALAAVSRHPDAAAKRPARTIRRRGSACSRRPARRCRSSTSCTTRSCGSPACPLGGSGISSIARSSRRPGPRDEFIKFIANNRAFAARVAKETGMQPQ